MDYAEPLPTQGAIVPKVTPGDEKLRDTVAPPPPDGAGLHSPIPSLDLRKGSGLTNNDNARNNSHPMETKNDENQWSDESESEEDSHASISNMFNIPESDSLQSIPNSWRESSDRSDDLLKNLRAIDGGDQSQSGSQPLEGLNSDSFEENEEDLQVDDSQYESSLEDVDLSFPWHQSSDASVEGSEN